jgi:divalent metal cation (Fe/Co/Zn/Cd) transporter
MSRDPGNETKDAMQPDGKRAGVASTPDHIRGPSKEELRAGFAKLRKLEWITLAYQIGAAALVGFSMGGSQAMKTEWLENMLAIIPVAGVLLTYQTENKQEDTKRPFGYHRAGTVAFVGAAFALAGVGTYLFYDALMKLIHREYPAIGGYTAFGHTFWHGWLMIAVMFVTAVPPMMLARAKTPVAKLLHDKALYADADMNRANWLSNGSGIVGLLLMAWGFWWGDALAALFISFDIMRDGWNNVAKSLSDVMDHHPVDLETDRQDPVVAEVHRALRSLPFVAAEKTLIREHGRYIFAEIFIQPNDRMPPTTEASRRVRAAILSLDWRLQHIVVEFTADLEDAANVLTREELEIESDL